MLYAKSGHMGDIANPSCPHILRFIRALLNTHKSYAAVPIQVLILFYVFPNTNYP